jgi:uncharacterized surface protein with fasciclin (FAS1) repeats
MLRFLPLTQTSRLFTLPASASETLPFLGVDNFLDALNHTGILAELDARTGPITILAPDDKAFTNSSTLSRDQLTALVRQHVLVDYHAYTPLLRDGDVYPTLAGGKVVVSVDEKGAVFLDGARILDGDAIITNGAVHTISKVRINFDSFSFYVFGHSTTHANEDD